MSLVVEILVEPIVQPMFLAMAIIETSVSDVSASLLQARCYIHKMK